MPRFRIGNLGSDSAGKASLANLQGTVGGEKGRADQSFTSTEAHTFPLKAHK